VSLVVVDASVVLQWFVPERDAAAATRLLDGDHEFIAPDLLFAEVANALSKKVRRRELTREQAQRLAGDLAGIAVETVPCRALAADALAIAQAAGITVYDALYLVLAVRIDSWLVTADERLHDAVAALPSLGERVRLVSELT